MEKITYFLLGLCTAVRKTKTKNQSIAYHLAPTVSNFILNSSVSGNATQFSSSHIFFPIEMLKLKPSYNIYNIFGYICNGKPNENEISRKYTEPK